MLQFKNVQDQRWLDRYLTFIHHFNLDTNEKTSHKHHIMPGSLYPKFRSLNKHPWNKAVLSHRAHLIAHYMLAKALGGTMWFAYNNMNAFGCRLNSTLYEQALAKISEEQSVRQLAWLQHNPHPKGMLGKRHTEATKNKMSAWSSQTFVERFGVDKSNEIKHKLSSYKRTSECKQKISKGKLLSGYVHSEETRALISNTRKQGIADGSIVINITKETREKQAAALKAKYSLEAHHTKGKTYEEIMGKDKADKLKLRRSVNNRSSEPAVRAKLSAALKGRKFTESHKQNIASLVWMNNGIKNKRSKPNMVAEWEAEGWNKGKLLVECGYCHKLTDQANLKQWHGENCKLKGL